MKPRLSSSTPSAVRSRVDSSLTVGCDHDGVVFRCGLSVGVNHSGVAVHLDAGVRTALGVAVNCLETLTADWNRDRLDEEGVNRRTIFVDTTGVAATDFGLNAATRQRLFANGQAAARKFLANLPT